MIVRKFYKPHLMIQIYGVPLKMMWKNFILAAISQGKRDKEQIIKRSVGNEQKSVTSLHTTFTNMLSGHRWHHQVCKIIDTELLSRKTLAMALAGRSLTPSLLSLTHTEAINPLRDFRPASNFPILLYHILSAGTTCGSWEILCLHFFPISTRVYDEFSAYRFVWTQAFGTLLSYQLWKS